MVAFWDDRVDEKAISIRLRLDGDRRSSCKKHNICEVNYKLLMTQGDRYVSLTTYIITTGDNNTFLSSIGFKMRFF
jgi:hypothetical protein